MIHQDLTPNEVKVLNAVYELESADVHQLREYFSDEKEWKYTTVQTFANNLANKGFLRRQRISKRFMYLPTYDRATFFSRVLRHLFGRSLRNDPAPVVHYLFNTKAMTADETKRVKKVLDGAESSGKDTRKK